MTIFRWKALGPMLGFLVIVIVLWTLFIDHIIRKTVEWAGTAANGAEVDLSSATLHTFRGRIDLGRLQVTNPKAPATNRLDIAGMTADIHVAALLEKKANVETLSVSGVRFGTPRARPGRVVPPDTSKGFFARELASFADRAHIPPLDLSGLARLTGWHGVSADSLQTPKQAKAIQARGDSVKTALEGSLRAADPTPAIDSARALADRLKNQNPRTLGPAGAVKAAQDVRTALANLQASQQRLTSLKGDVDRGMQSVRTSVASLDDARKADYQYALHLVHVPSLEAPDLSASVFQRMALERIQPYLDMLAKAEQYIPPGLRPRRTTGPKRLRMAGTDFHFPKEHHYPTFLVALAHADVTLGGTGAAAGTYLAEARGVTTEPPVYGRPMTFTLMRSAAAQGPDRIRAYGLIDRVTDTPRDSLAATLTGVDLPGYDVSPVGAHLALGKGNLEITLARHGEQLLGRWHVVSDSVSWSRLGASTSTGADPAEKDSTKIGSKAWVDALLWRTVSGLRAVDVDARISGTLRDPRIDINSNVGGALSQSLSRAVGAEVQRLQAQARADVDRLVAQPIADARAKADQIQSGVAKQVSDAQAKLDQAKADLEAKLRELTSPLQQLPGGLPRLPRP